MIFSVNVIHSYVHCANQLALLGRSVRVRMCILLKFKWINESKTRRWRNRGNRLRKMYRCPRSERRRQAVASSPSRPDSRSVPCVWWRRTAPPECTRTETRISSWSCLRRPTIWHQPTFQPLQVLITDTFASDKDQGQIQGSQGWLVTPPSWERTYYITKIITSQATLLDNESFWNLCHKIIHSLKQFIHC